MRCTTPGVTEIRKKHEVLRLLMHPRGICFAFAQKCQQNLLNSSGNSCGHVRRVIAQGGTRQGVGNRVAQSQSLCRSAPRHDQHGNAIAVKRAPYPRAPATPSFIAFGEYRRSRPQLAVAQFPFDEIRRASANDSACAAWHPSASTRAMRWFPVSVGRNSGGFGQTRA